MDVLTNTFELPLSMEELKAKQAKERINIGDMDKSKLSNSFEGLKDIEVTNQTPTPTPTPAPKKAEPPQPKVKPVPTPPKPRPEPNPDVPPPPDPLRILPTAVQPQSAEQSSPSKADEDFFARQKKEEDEVIKGHGTGVELQFKWDEEDIPGLINMPNGARNLDMMNAGEGVKNLKPGRWVRAWSIIDNYDAIQKYPYAAYDWLVKGQLTNAEGRLTTNLISSSIVIPSIFKYNGKDENGDTDWEDLNHSKGQPIFKDRQLLVATTAAKTGSPVDVYDPASKSWSAYSGDLPALDASDTGVHQACIHGGSLYIATSLAILEASGGGWSIVHSITPAGVGSNAPDSYVGLASDGKDLYYGLLYKQNYYGKFELHKSGGGIVATIDTPGVYWEHGSIGYGTNSNKFYVSKFNNNILDNTYSITKSGETKTLSSPSVASTYPTNTIASGSLYDYISSAEKLYRIEDDSLVEIYSRTDDDGNPYEIGNLCDYEEQVLMGGGWSIFHTEMEESVVRAARKGQDSKFPT